MSSSICANKDNGLCRGTGGFSKNSQKYGNYNYCSKCVDISLRNTVKHSFIKMITDTPYFTKAKCVDCNKSLNAGSTILSFDKKCNLLHMSKLSTIKEYVVAFCRKCSRKKKNKTKINKFPWITDQLVEIYGRFLKTTDSELGSYDEYEENDSDDFDDEEDDKSESNEVDEDSELTSRVATLFGTITKMNLSYLLCTICSDDEIYNRILQKTSE